MLSHREADAVMLMLVAAVLFRLPSKRHRIYTV